MSRTTRTCTGSVTAQTARAIRFRCATNVAKSNAPSSFLRSNSPGIPIRESAPRRTCSGSDRRDRRQIGGPKDAVRLHQNRHLATVAAHSVRHPADVHDAVHGLVGYLERELVAGDIQRREQMAVEIAWRVG